ncbi:hypothetical protein [Oceanobacillus iheyensis]|nr:hypothetical protein [Oceanobacillus iheyensis]
MSDSEIFFNFLISSICLLIIITSYHIRFKSTGNIEFKEAYKRSLIDNNLLYKRVKLITNTIFLVGILSIVLLIIEVGSLKNYLALGSMTRGLDKSPTEYINSSYLQLITLSVVILIPPYLYLFLYRMKKDKIMIFMFFISLFFAVLYLLYNQGRAPLIIFFLPFFFVIGKIKKRGMFGLVLLFGLGLFLLSYLDAIFQYLAYGYYEIEQSENYISQFLKEFSYPFANFSLRYELIDFSGFRYMYDYVIWPFTMIPSSLLSLFGLSKEAITSVSTFNTEAYGAFLGVNTTGGIPVDFLTFNFYQFGYISLLPMCFVIGRLLRMLDKVFYFFKGNIAITILLYRISFSMIGILNNSDLSAIMRNRLDVVLLLVIIIYIYMLEKKRLRIKELNNSKFIGNMERRNYN